MIKVALCIPTCNRPEYLSTCLREINQIEINSDVYDIQVIVVDNGSIEKADRTFKEETAHFRFIYSYHTEERKGIPFVRNKCIDIALNKKCHYLIFIDDDEYPDKQWLHNLLSFAVDANAGIVTGPVLSDLSRTQHRKWLDHCDIFNRNRHPHRSTVGVFATNNVLLRLDILIKTGLRFDETMSFCGGSDIDLALRLVRMHNTVYWCDTAVVYETVPEARCTFRWVFSRYLRQNTNQVHMAYKYKLPRLNRLQFFINGIIMILQGLTYLLLSLGFLPIYLCKAVRKLGLGCGFIYGSIGIRYQEYKKYHEF